MYLFVSNWQKIKKYDDFCEDFLCSNRLPSLRKIVKEYYVKYSKLTPDTLTFNNKWGAVVEKYNKNVIGWIVKVDSKI